MTKNNGYGKVFCMIHDIDENEGFEIFNYLRKINNNGGGDSIFVPLTSDIEDISDFRYFVMAVEGFLPDIISMFQYVEIYDRLGKGEWKENVAKLFKNINLAFYPNKSTL